MEKQAKSIAAFFKDLDNILQLGFWNSLNEQARQRLAAFPATISSMSCEAIVAENLKTALSRSNRSPKTFNLNLKCCLHDTFTDLKLLLFMEQALNRFFVQLNELNLHFELSSELQNKLSSVELNAFKLSLFPYVLKKLQAEFNALELCCLKMMQLGSDNDIITIAIPRAQEQLYTPLLMGKIVNFYRTNFNLHFNYRIHVDDNLHTAMNQEQLADYEAERALLNKLIRQQQEELAANRNKETVAASDAAPNVRTSKSEATDIPNGGSGGAPKKSANGKWLKVEDEAYIFGHVPQQAALTELADFNIESQKVMLKGMIHALESRTVKNGESLLVKFNLFGENGAVKCFLFSKTEKFLPVLEKLHDNMWVELYVEACLDRFSNELQAKILGIRKSESPTSRSDNAPEKRVELHCHSKMSAKDGFSEPQEILKLAASFGHKACAITDHGVVQAYPAMYNTKKQLKKAGKDIKLIYGMEGYLVDDGNCVVFGSDISKDKLTTFVAFDLETTGLDASCDRIIEIAAVRYTLDENNNYVESDTFSTLVNPGGVLSPKISELTGINSLDLVGKPEPAQAVKDFHAWLANAPLVAHNGLFDLGFLRNEAFRMAQGNEARLKFNNLLVDTVEMARTFYTGLANYKLDTVAKALHVELTQHHRALADARCCGEIFIALIKELAVDNLAALNEKAGKAETSEIKQRHKQVLHFIALCQNSLGLYNLYRLVSESHINYFSGRPRIPRSLLRYYRSGLLLGSSCEAGEVFKSMHNLYRDTNKNMTLAKERLQEYRFKQLARFYDYLEVQPLSNNAFFLRDESSGLRDENDLANVNRLIIALAKKNKKPFVATSDSHFLHRHEQIYRNMLLSVNGFNDADLSPCLYFLNTEEMLEAFAYLDEEDQQAAVIGNPGKLASKVEDNIPPFPEGTFPPQIPGADQAIIDMVWAEAKRRYEFAGKLPEIVEARVNKELDSIISNGFAIMYYISAKLVKKSNDDGYFVGSRGSVGSSFVATLSGITEVNPLTAHYLCKNCRYSEFPEQSKYDSGFDLPKKDCPHCGTLLDQDGQNIPFETFLGFNGDKEPDIDLNFSGEYQNQAHNFIREMFGSDYTFRAGTIASYKEKNAIGVVKKYAESHEITYTEADTLRLANGICGVKRTTGQHPGGIVVIPKERDIYDFTPIQYPADNSDSSMYTTHFDFNSLHDTILKFDCLGHDAPTQLKKLKDLTGIDFLDLPLNDERVMSLYKSADELQLSDKTFVDVGCLGLPEQGTIMARGMIKETKPASFYDLVQLAGLSHGTNVWNGNARELINEGICTIDQVIGCRDSIMTTLINYKLPAKASFDIMEQVRKGKGLKDEQIDLMRECNVPEWYIDSCLKIQYLFPKAHAVAYVMSALRIAWYKLYRKEAFYAVWLSNNLDEFNAELIINKSYDEIKRARENMLSNFKKLNARETKLYYILEIIEEMMLRGVKLLPIDLYKSDANNFLPEGEALRPPFAVMPKFPRATAEQIVKVRAETTFVTREDLANKADVKQAAMELLQAFKVVEDLPLENQMDLSAFANFKI